MNTTKVIIANIANLRFFFNIVFTCSSCPSTPYILLSLILNSSLFPINFSVILSILLFRF